MIHYRITIIEDNDNPMVYVDGDESGNGNNHEILVR